jgi:hypothetical protein
MPSRKAATAAAPSGARDRRLVDQLGRQIGEKATKYLSAKQERRRITSADHPSPVSATDGTSYAATVVAHDGSYSVDPIETIRPLRRADKRGGVTVIPNMPIELLFDEDRAASSRSVRHPTSAAMSTRSRTKAGEIRRALVASGFSPLPLNGKAPVLKEWQSKLKTNDGEIQLWDSMYPNAINTGILTKFTPAIDIDIIVPDAAARIEDLARETFGEHGHILVRFGNRPKRAVLLQTNEPFAKIARSFTAPDGSEQKIEILADGQQVVVAGIHPDIHQDYTWHGGDPWTTPREHLPYVREADIRAFLDKAARLLHENFGFIETGGTKQKTTNGEA